MALLAASCGADSAEGAADWPHPNFDTANTRATTASKINSSNVDQLAEKWRYELARRGAGGAAATNPVIIDGVVYLGDLFTNVHAIDLTSGEAIWMVDNAETTDGPSGVAVAGGRVFANRNGDSIAAYDATDGRELWSTNLLQNGGGVNIQPVTTGELVLAATSSLAIPGGRGTLFALDQATGRIMWSFDTIVSEDLWGHPEINSGGGAWYPPAIDAEAGLSYWGTSNPYPYPGSQGFPNGSSRPGDNKWTNSIVNIDLDSGELVWGHQAVAHDIFDRDTVVAAIVDLTEGGQVIISTGKLGRVIGLDPGGTVLWDTPVGMHLNDDVESFEGSLEVLPGPAGGVETPIAVADDIIYVPVVNAPALYTAPDVPGSTATVRLSVFPSQLVAIDATNGEIIWDVEVPGASFGAATVVNDLVFTSVFDGQILAYDRATGAQVWSYQAPGRINASPAMVEGMLVVPVGIGSPPVLLALGLPEE